MSKIECIWERPSLLGEGVRYDERRNSVWWVDILGQRIMHLRLSDGFRQEWETPTTVGTTFAGSDGEVLVLLRDCVARFDPVLGTYFPLISFESEPASNRFNDGMVGPDGTIWVGSMDYDFQQPTGMIHSISPSGNTTLRDKGYTVVNGPALSHDGKKLFINDTMNGAIFCYDRDPLTNDLHTKRLFAQIEPSDGLPDGICTDIAGGVWVALVTGGKARRYLPTGQIDFDIKLPSPIVTSVGFGGKDRSTLFVATGRILMTEADLGNYPLSGSLFRIPTDFEGSQVFTAPLNWSEGGALK